MKKHTKIIRNILFLVLIAFIAYFGGNEFFTRASTHVGDKLSEYITGEPYQSDEKGNTDKLTGTITHVSDGDTAILKDKKGKKHKIRLNGIDAPEIGQDYGEESRDYLKKMALKKYVNVDIVGIDQYDRVLGVIYIDSVNVNKLMLENGLAWQYRFNNDRSYKELVKQAKQKNLNIWSNRGAMDPYVWRKQNNRQ